LANKNNNLTAKTVVVRSELTTKHHKYNIKSTWRTQIYFSLRFFYCVC